MKRKRILVVSHYYPPHIGGIEIVAQNQAVGLAALGHQVTVISSSVSPVEISRIEAGVNVIRVKAWNVLEKIGVPFPLFSPRLIAALLKETKRSDIVHIHDAFYISSFFGAMSARIRKTPIILTQHVALIAHRNRIVNKIQRFVYATSGAVIFRMANRILVLNDGVQAFLLSRHVTASKIEWLPNALDTELFHPASKAEKRAAKAKFGLPTDKPIVLFVGRYVLKKGFDSILAAQSDNYHLAFAGGESKLPDSDFVSFLGKAQHDAMAEIYHTADIFLMPSEDEGFPLSIQEAMASGLPIVMTDDPGYKRYNLDRELIYFLVDSRPATIREALTSLVGDQDRLDRMAAYSTRYSTQQFSRQTLIAQLEAIYQSTEPTEEAFA